MHSLPFGQPGRFYRGNLHTHSTRSDGARDPAAVIAAYRARGYDFLALTDHFLPAYDFPIVDTTGWRDEGFTTLLGAELHAPALENGAAWHLLAVGLPPDFAPTGPDETGPTLAARARAAGAFVGMAHPHWYTQTVEDALSIEAADAVEVFNTNCQVEAERGESWHLADLLLARGRRLLAYATDDAHFHNADAFGAWVQVRAASLEPTALLAALKAGHFYSSQGPELHDVRIENGWIHVACSPASAIIATGPGHINKGAFGEGLEEAKLLIAAFAGRYFRLTVVDSNGKRAWTNPIWLDGR